MTEQRDRRGRYIRGNCGGPGRPPRPTETAYLSALMEACPPETWRQICDRAVQDARNGDPKARDWLGRYVVGEPKLSAPAPVVALVQAITGADPVVEAIARPIIARESMAAFSPLLAEDDALEERIREQVAQELDELDGQS